MTHWHDIKVGETYRIRNTFGQELDRTVIRADPKKLIIQRHEDKQGETREVITDIFIKVYNRMGISAEGQVEITFKEEIA